GQRRHPCARLLPCARWRAVAGDDLHVPRRAGLTKLPLQAVPNVSEGRNRGVVDAIAAAYTTAGATLARTHRDIDHHRSVHVLFGTADTLVDALVAGVGVAAETIDLSR